MYYLAEHRGWRDPVVVSVNNTSMAARLGEHYGIETHETPVGFKFIGPKMIETGAMMGAEESGGFGFGMHLPERDGVYADLLLLDLFMRERAAGRWPVSRAIEHFHEIAGPSFYLRIDVHVERAAYPETKRRLLVDLAAAAPTELAGEPVARTVPLETGDGFKFFLADGSWLLIRTSGTEPLVRIYTEATLGGRCAMRCWPPASGWCADDRGRATAARRVDKPWGHELDLGPHGPLCRQGPGHRGRQAAVAPAPRGQGRIDLRDIRPAPSLPRGRGRDRPGRGADGRRRTATSRPAGSTATRRSSGRELMEVSTPELDDVVRLEDDFGREGTNAP